MSKVIPIAQVRNVAGKANAAPHALYKSSIGEPACLDKMCNSLLSSHNRKRFRAFPECYCREYGLSLEQIHAVTDLDILHLLQLGCSIPNMERLTSIYGLDILSLCMEQTGKSLDEVRHLLR
jgi:hypothetical protein